MRRKLEWQRNEEGVYFADLFGLRIEIQARDNAWSIVISDFFLGRCGTSDDRFVGTLEEAKRRAFALGAELFAPFVEAVRTEAALAEREACARKIADGIPSHSSGAAAGTQAFIDGFVVRALERLRDRIRARTTPAKLSTETLAEIAESRGLRVVEPEYLDMLAAAAPETPALRWENCNGHWSAFIGPWRVTATEGSWTLCGGPLRGSRVVIESGRRSDLRDNKLAAEAALRGIGISFHVEESAENGDES